MLPPTLIHTQKNLKTPTMNMYFYSDYKSLMCLKFKIIYTKNLNIKPLGERLALTSSVEGSIQLS